MQRPAESRPEVLWSVVELFWAQGAERTAYPQIVRATGASRKALYSWWPDKSEMVRDALALYQQRILAPALALLALGGRPALVAFWDEVEAVVSDKAWRGCFLCRTAGGPYADDPFVAELFLGHMERLQHGLTAAIAGGQREQLVSESVDPAAAGAASAALIVLLSTAASAGEGPEKLRAFVASGRVVCGLESGAGRQSMPTR